MGYNRADLIRIKGEYHEKYLNARKLADLRCLEVYGRLPRVREIDKILSKTALEIMSAATSGDKDEIENIKKRNGILVAERERLLIGAGYPKDYTDVQYECKKCDDSGYVDEKMCECMKRALIVAGYESSGLGSLISKQSFDNFSLEYYRSGGASYDTMKRYYSSLKSFAEEFNSKTYRNFLLIGGTGLGKTHLSTAVAKTVIDNGYDVLYVSAIDMFSDFERKQFGNGEDDTERYFNCDLLIIDDLGTELTNQFTVSCLYNVINSRINSSRSTFINTNLSKREIESKYAERITSRLFGEYYPLLFCGIDIRKQKM